MDAFTCGCDVMHASPFWRPGKSTGIASRPQSGVLVILLKALGILRLFQTHLFRRQHKAPWVQCTVDPFCPHFPPLVELVVKSWPEERTPALPSVHRP